MRKLILKMSVSLDGFVGGSNEEIDWIFPRMDEGAIEWTLESIWSAGAHLMGSRTFHDMKAYWPTPTDPFAAAMNEIPKIVFSSPSPVALLKAIIVSLRPRYRSIRGLLSKEELCRTKRGHEP
jgi:dihydrofolate reductase